MIRFVTTDELLLHGLLIGSSRKVVIHVHGKSGNHYENRFLWDLAAALNDVDIALFTFSNRGCNVLTEAYQASRLIYTGGAVERFSESMVDIDAAISALDELGLSAVALQGHSFGCEKVVNYARSRMNSDMPLILLSPADSEQNIRTFLAHGERAIGADLGPYPDLQETSSESAVMHISWSNNRLLCPYGVVKNDGSWYPVPMESTAIVDSLSSGALSTLLQGTPIERRVVAYVGTSDPLHLRSPGEWIAHLRLLMPKVDLVVVQGGDHNLGPSTAATAKVIATKVQQFVKS